MLKQFSFLLPFLLAVTACKKTDQLAKTHSEELCTVSRAAIDGQVIPGQYIIAYNPITTGNGLSVRSAARMGEEVLERNGIDDAALEASIQGKNAGFVARLSARQAAELKEDPAVAHVEPDRIIALAHCFQVVEPRLVTWNIEKVGYGDGRGKTAWVIDSGIDFDHPDLNVDSVRSRSFVTGTPSADDENGHGTHVAGIIGAKNNTFGVLGVASGATLISLRVLDKEGKGSLSAIVKALAYINANAKPGDVVNMSLGEEGISEILDQQVQQTAARGIYISMAAGNEKKPAIDYSPGRANGPNLFTVSAVDSLNNFATFSNYGNDVVDFAAPGVRVLSTFSNGRYARMSGTSMAAPHVAGLLLLNGPNLKSSGSALSDPDGTPDLIVRK